jgi:hypothetical protein
MTAIRHPGKLAVQARYWRLHGRPDVAERLEAALVAGARCKRCGRTLTDPVSIAAGIGPECGKTDVPHRVVLYVPEGGHPWQFRAYCLGCSWAWDGIGDPETVKRQHEQLNDPAATTKPDEEP